MFGSGRFGTQRDSWPDAEVATRRKRNDWLAEIAEVWKSWHQKQRRATAGRRRRSRNSGGCGAGGAQTTEPAPQGPSRWSHLPLTGTRERRHASSICQTVPHVHRAFTLKQHMIFTQSGSLYIWATKATGFCPCLLTCLRTARTCSRILFQPSASGGEARRPTFATVASHGYIRIVILSVR